MRENTRREGGMARARLAHSGVVCGLLGQLTSASCSPALPSVLINIRTTVQTVVVGHAVEFECLALGDPKPQVTWSKVGGHLRPGIVQSGNVIRIAHVELADAGQYRCTATNAAGTTQSHVLLLVQGEGQQGPRWGTSGRGLRGCPLLLACFAPPSCCARDFPVGIFKGQVSLQMVAQGGAPWKELCHGHR